MSGFVGLVLEPITGRIWKDASLMPSSGRIKNDTVADRTALGPEGNTDCIHCLRFSFQTTTCAIEIIWQAFLTKNRNITILHKITLKDIEVDYLSAQYMLCTPKYFPLEVSAVEVGSSVRWKYTSEAIVCPNCT